MSDRADALKDIRDVLTDAVYRASEEGDLKTLPSLARELRSTWAELDEVEGSSTSADVTPLERMRREREERLKAV